MQRYAYYNDTEGFSLVKAHLDKLKKEIDEREEVSVRSFPSGGSEREEAEDGEPQTVQTGVTPRKEEILRIKAEEEIFRLKASLDEKEREVQSGKEAMARLEDENVRLKLQVESKNE
ncbi:hypothetical protein TrRE_jg3682 [Triparma retinervis]|uniref:Uncharacterized protein n=1 Tax=Triparma retinervis TaxID=2557542 RepID=A0A9W6ZAL9_9STRA|nr:hypothetical protein TrRE_jg3682 [Triparma retinervis]